MTENEPRKDVFYNTYSEIARLAIAEIPTVTPDHRRAILSLCLLSGINRDIKHLSDKHLVNRDQIDAPDNPNNVDTIKAKESNELIESSIQRLIEQKFQLDLSFVRDASLNEARLEIKRAVSKTIANFKTPVPVDIDLVYQALYRAMCLE